MSLYRVSFRLAAGRCAVQPKVPPSPVCVACAAPMQVKSMDDVETLPRTKWNIQQPEGMSRGVVPFRASASSL